MQKKNHAKVPKTAKPKAARSVQHLIVRSPFGEWIFALFSALLFSAGIVHGSTVYVKTNGNDSLSGANWALA